MAWHLNGMYYENCSCTATCPCTWSNMQFAATTERCNATLAFAIDDGDIDGVDVSGRTFVLMVDSPPLMSEGGWNVGVIVDDGASPEQVEALGAVVSGALGGPPAALGPLLGNFLGIEQMPVSISTENGEHTVTFGDSSYTGRPHTNDSGEVVSLTGVDTHPAGPVLELAPVSTSSISAMGISFGGEGLSGFANPFSWAA
ncbi:MAG: DUF1326 domain-containing protein [Acidimicrobiales bacterium]|nr:DUF1326 domain-containing protein [Acidimicrobiales bacterium]